ncbi:protein starmaker-like [Atheta coriaria]|uniref:protein starmaker-like n=1 Tax=Dalotia coriaria TaxID=877792 RepID=UPI0031F457E7
MSARREQNDSDGSWTWVDNEENNFRKRAESRRASSYERAHVEEVQDIHAHDDTGIDSDISILTDPEDHPEAAEYAEEGTPLGSNDLEQAKQHFKDLAAEMQTAAAVKAALDVAKPGESELAVTERRVRSYFRSTLTSAGFIIGGLIIATYCQWGCDNNITSPVQEYYSRPYDDQDIEFIQPDTGKYNKKGYKNKDNLKYAAQAHKNAKEKYEDDRPGQRGGKRKHDDYDDHHEIKHKQQKGDSKHKKDKYKDYDSHEHKVHKEKKPKHNKGHDDSDEDKENFRREKKDKHEKEKYQESHNKKNDVKKHDKHDKHQEHEDYLHKKEAYLKQKESKLKQKEYKLYAKDSSNEKHAKRDGKDKKEKKNKFNKHNDTASGEWYDNMHKGRKDKRQQDEKADWMFERAQGRDKKRDKAHWYFDMMDERETNRFKKS